MPVRYQRDDERRRILITTEWPFDLDELKANLDRQIAEGTWSYGVIYDARGFVGDPPSHDVLTMLSHYVGRLIAHHGPRGPVALVAVKPAWYGMHRMYSMQNADVSLVRPCKDFAEAEQWLDHELDWPRPLPSNLPDFQTAK